MFPLKTGILEHEEITENLKIEEALRGKRTCPKQHIYGILLHPSV